MTGAVYYVNGAYVPAGAAALPVNDLGLLRGYGVFDFLRTYHHMPFHLREHLLRLEYSARTIGIDLPWSLEELEAIVGETYRRNPLENASIRILVTGGPSIDFMTPQNRPSLVVMVHAITPFPDEYYRHGTKAITVEMDRLMPTVKSIHYIPAIMAMAEARKVGAVEAIYRDGDGYLSEGTRSNLFVFRGDRLSTPNHRVLKGITREVVMEIARPHFELVEEPLRVEELGRVDEAFLTSTTKEVLPVVQVDNLRIGSGAPGPNTQRMMALFRDYVEATVRVVV